MLTVSSLGKSFGARKLFQDVTLQLDAPRRVGLVGANGSGKSTFLKILADEESASEAPSPAHAVRVWAPCGKIAS
jgi:ATPase subunit of ABC transporter with duplicated ATPase domains